MPALVPDCGARSKEPPFTLREANIFGIITLVCCSCTDHLAYAPQVIWMLGFYGIGFGFYISHAPERWFPGAFDLFLHSHQLWHLCVLGAVLVWYLSCIAAVALLDTRGCAAFVPDNVLEREHLGLRGGLRSSEKQERRN